MEITQQLSDKKIRTNMSSNKTVIPGMESSYEPTQESRGQQFPGSGTYVPGNLQTPAGTKMTEKPIIGFLYSVSRTPSGEFWPLHIGSNTIGRSSECDVCLSEGTVSEQHAVLVVRMMKNPEKVIASVCDARSTMGTMINGESLGFDQRECFNGDIITIGAHYDLYFILIDVKQIGLNVCRDFIPTQQFTQHVGMPSGFPPSAGNNPMANTSPFANPYAAPVGRGINRTKGYDESNDGGYVSGGTMGLNEGPTGSEQHGESKAQPGHTIFM